MTSPNPKTVTDPNKQKIIDLFNSQVRGKQADTGDFNKKHAGKAGHWLEQQMGIAANASNSPDIYDYEMKNATRGKTTFGDWSADFYIWKDPAAGIDRDMFLQIFGKANEQKNGRFSWSGEPIPKINTYSRFGQILEVDNHDNITILYSYSQDQRDDKDSIVPPHLRLERLPLARWDQPSMKKKVEKKFNQQGWFKCEQNKEGVYNEIVFGAPITFPQWIDDVRKGLVFFDSGMYQGNTRLYSQWRANNQYWESLVVERY